MNTEDHGATTTVGEFLLARLNEIGVRHVFGVPGDFNLEFLEQLQAYPGIQWIGNCNELNAAYAADGYARINGIGALVTTYGVGELSSINGIAGAYAERVPVIAITGAPSLAHMNSRALLHHTLANGNFENMMICMRQFTVAQARLTPQNAAMEIDRCVRACLIEKRPVYLQLPADIALLDVVQHSHTRLDVQFQSDRAMLAEFAKRVIDRLRKATRPAILVDADVDRFHLIAKLHAFLDASRLPLALLSSAKGIVSDSYPQYLGIYSGAVSRPHVRNAIESSDALLTLGVRLTDGTSGAFSQTLHSANEIRIEDWCGKIDGEDFYGISMSDVLEALTDALGTAPLVHTPVEKPAVQSASPMDDGSGAITQAAFWKRIAAFLKKGDVIIADNGTPMIGVTGTPLPPDVRVIAQPIWASIGYTLPATLGSVLAAPERRHLLFIGDGSFQVTAQELSTILRYRLNPIVFLLNNDGYTIERLILGENSSYNDIQPWRYSDLCGVFSSNGGFRTVRVENSAQLDSSLQLIDAPEECVFIEVILERLDAPPLLKTLGPVFARLDYGIKWDMKGRPGGKPVAG